MTFCGSSSFGYEVLGACQRLRQLSWIRLLLSGFDMDLVLFWMLQGGSPCANLPSTETPEERWKQTCICVLTVPLESLTLTFWQNPFWALIALKFWMQQHFLFLCFFFLLSPWERKRPGVFAWETDTDRRLSVQTIGENEADRRWNGVVLPFLPTELCLKFVVRLRKVPN